MIKRFVVVALCMFFISFSFTAFADELGPDPFTAVYDSSLEVVDERTIQLKERALDLEREKFEYEKSVKTCHIVTF